MLLLDNRDKKKGEGTRAELRRRDAKEKLLESKHDTASQRGFFTEQCLETESLDGRMIWCLLDYQLNNVL